MRKNKQHNGGRTFEMHFTEISFLALDYILGKCLAEMMEIKMMQLNPHYKKGSHELLLMSNKAT